MSKRQSRGKKLVAKSLRDEENLNKSVDSSNSVQSTNVMEKIRHENKPLPVPETSSNIIETGTDLINFKYNLRKRTPVKPPEQLLSVTETEEAFPGDGDGSDYKPCKTGITASCNTTNAETVSIHIDDQEDYRTDDHTKGIITPQTANSEEDSKKNLIINNFTIEIEAIEKDCENIHNDIFKIHQTVTESIVDDINIPLEQCTTASNCSETDQKLVENVVLVPTSDIIIHQNDFNETEVHKEKMLAQGNETVTKNIILNNKKDRKKSYSLSELEEIKVFDEDENKSENNPEEKKKISIKNKKAKSISSYDTYIENKNQIRQIVKAGMTKCSKIGKGLSKEKKVTKTVYTTSELEELKIVNEDEKKIENHHEKKEKSSVNEKKKKGSVLLNDSYIQDKETIQTGPSMEREIYEKNNSIQEKDTTRTETNMASEVNREQNIVQNTETVQIMETEMNEEQTIKQKKRSMPMKENPGRKRIRNESQWKSVIMKNKKNSGEEYINRKGKLVPKKEMKSGCSYNCLRGCKNKISEKERQDIFQHFWGLKSHDNQLEFISRYVKRVNKKQIIVTDHPSRRKWSYEYYFLVNKQETRVCKKMFLDTLSITDMWIQTIFHKIDKLGTGVILKDGRGCHKNHRITITETVKQSVREHILAIPVVESHYVRSRSSKLYFDETLNLPKLYAMYESWMQENYPNQVKATSRQYKDIFHHEFNIDFNKPKKDLCLHCDIFKKANNIERDNLEYEHALHIANKTIVRKLKEEDKKSSEKSGSVVITACYDLEKVLSTPQSEVSVFYYKRKLNVYNFTIFDIGNKKGYCYLWDETVAKKGSNEISSFVYNFIEKYVEKGAKEFIFYSDGCGGQNKNRTVFSMYSKACKTFQINITHNFFETGHSQSEGDSMHALIEKRKKNQTIYTPSQWAPLIKCAKVTGTPYDVTEVSQNDICDFKKYSKTLNWTYDTQKNKIAVKQIKHVHFSKAAPRIMHFQYNFYDENLMSINLERKKTTKEGSNPQRGRLTKRGRGRPKNAVNVADEASQTIPTDVEITKAYNAPLPISLVKFKDLMSLCTSKAIPEVHHEYYKNIPHAHAENENNRNAESSDSDST